MKEKLFMIQIPLSVDGVFRWRKASKEEIMERYYNAPENDNIILSYYRESDNLRAVLLGRGKVISYSIDNAIEMGYDIYILDKEK